LPSPQDNLLEAILLGDQTKLTSCSAKEIKTAQAAGGKCAKLKEQFNFPDFVIWRQYQGSI